MSTINIILEPNADGTVHVPIPPELRHGKVKVIAELEPVIEEPKRAKAGIWKDLPGKFWMADDFDAPLEDFKDLARAPSIDTLQDLSQLKGFGSLKGATWMAHDFDEPLDDFKDYTD